MDDEIRCGLATLALLGGHSMTRHNTIPEERAQIGRALAWLETELENIAGNDRGRVWEVVSKSRVHSAQRALAELG